MAEIKYSCHGLTPNKGANPELTIDGINIIAATRAVSFRAEAGRLNVATIDLIAEFDITVTAEVELNVYPHPGYAVDVIPLPDGGTRYITHRVDDDAYIRS